MARLQHELYIEAPPDRVFELLAQPERTPEWSPSVVSIRRTSEGPIGVGSTTEAVVKALGIEQHASGRCTLFDPPRRFVVENRTNTGAKSRTDTALLAEGQGTRLYATLDYAVPGGPLVAKLVGGQVRRDFEEGLQRLKTLLEAGQHPSPDP